MSRTTRYALAAACLAAIALTVMAGAWLLQPTGLTIGMVEGRRAETEVIMALQRNTSRRDPNLRVATRSYPDVAALKAAFERGEIEAASFDTAEAIPAGGRTVAVLGRRQLLMLGSSDRAAEIEGGRARIALVAGSPETLRAGELLLGLVIGPDLARQAERLDLAEALRRLQARRLDVVAFTASEATRRLREALRGYRGDPASSWTLLPVSDAERLAARNPEAETSTVAAGDLRAEPALPEDEVTVLSATTRLFVRDDLSDTAVAALARAVITERGSLARVAPAAARIEAPSTDRAAPLPTHPEVIAYLEGNEHSFFDRYGDLLYLGLSASAASARPWPGSPPGVKASAAAATCSGCLSSGS